MRSRAAWALEYSAASFRLSFQPGKISVQLVLGNPLATIEFFDTGVNLRLVRLAVGHQPFVPLVQHFQGAVNDVIGAAVTTGAKCLRNAVFLVGPQLNRHNELLV